MPEPTNWAPILAQWGFSAITSLLSFYVGATVAGKQQDRASQKRQSGIAAALLEDLNRIDEELMRMRERGLMPWNGLKRIPSPTIHPWVEALIAESAEEEPSVVAGFMRLERALASMEETAERAALACDELAGKHDKFVTLETNRVELLKEGGIEPKPLPEDREELLVLAAVPSALGAATARAKLEWQESLADEERILRDFRQSPQAVFEVLFDITTLLVPIAYRRLMPLQSLVASTWTKVGEDAELADMEVERLLRSHGFAYLADRRRIRRTLALP